MKPRELFRLVNGCAIPDRYFFKRHHAYDEMEINDTLIHYIEVDPTIPPRDYPTEIEELKKERDEYRHEAWVRQKINKELRDELRIACEALELYSKIKPINGLEVNVVATQALAKINGKEG